MKYNYVIFNSYGGKIGYKEDEDYYVICLKDLEGRDDVIINNYPLQDFSSLLLLLFRIHTHDVVGKITFVQDNESKSSYGVMRGLHFQSPPYSQSKLVRCVKGAVLDVAVDIRKGSSTYGQHVAVELTEENHRQFFIPKGFAHGFVVLSDTAVFQYKCDEFYHPEADGGINILDKKLNIDWHISTEKVILSDKDVKHPFIEDFITPFES